VRVLLVEDSRVVRTYVESILESAGDVTVLPTAVDGRQAVESALRERPDVILMDLEIPEIDGLTCIRMIMESAPCPIVVLSAHVVHRADPKTFQAFDAGAVDVMRKPEGLSPTEIEKFRVQLLRTIRAMASATVVRRSPSTRTAARRSNLPERLGVVIGASTGGPPIVHRLLSALGGSPPFAVLVAQHIVAGFERSFAEWLATSGVPIVLASDGTRLESGRVHIVPSSDAYVLDTGEFRRVDRGAHSILPSIDETFTCMAREFGPRTIGILLSGMGTDGAVGASRIRSAGGDVWTQLGSTCVVDGIPRAARDAGASSRDLTPDAMVQELRRLVGREPLSLA